MSSFPRYKEFQEQAWKEIKKNQPKYIISFDIDTSLLYDGKADLWILEKLNDLISEGYNLEAVMTMNKPTGRLIEISVIENGNESLAGKSFPIQIFRKKVK